MFLYRWIYLLQERTPFHKIQSVYIAEENCTGKLKLDTEGVKTVQDGV